jgi:GxxExxY protein
MTGRDGNVKTEPVPERVNELSRIAVDAALQVHRELGAGLLESVYEVCLYEELQSRGLKVERQAKVPIHYRGKQLDADLRLDLLVEDDLIIELKSVEAILPIHEAQLLTYLKLTGRRLGLLINFNVPLIKQGIRRLVL